MGLSECDEESEVGQELYTEEDPDESSLRVSVCSPERHEHVSNSRIDKSISQENIPRLPVKQAQPPRAVVAEL